MTDVDIKITACYLTDGTFENYSLKKSIYGRRNSKGYYETLQDVAFQVLFDVSISEVNDPDYRITLQEGHHPLRKCEPECGHTGYTQRPDKSIKKELMSLFKDRELISRATGKAKYIRILSSQRGQNAGMN